MSFKLLFHNYCAYFLCIEPLKEVVLILPDEMFTQVCGNCLISTNVTDVHLVT